MQAYQDVKRFLIVEQQEVGDKMKRYLEEILKIALSIAPAWIRSDKDAVLLEVAFEDYGRMGGVADLLRSGEVKKTIWTKGSSTEASDVEEFAAAYKEIRGILDKHGENLERSIEQLSTIIQPLVGRTAEEILGRKAESRLHEAEAEDIAREAKDIAFSFRHDGLSMVAALSLIFDATKYVVENIEVIAKNRTFIAELDRAEAKVIGDVYKKFRAFHKDLARVFPRFKEAVARISRLVVRLGIEESPIEDEILQYYDNKGEEVSVNSLMKTSFDWITGKVREYFGGTKAT